MSKYSSFSAFLIINCRVVSRKLKARRPFLAGTLATEGSIAAGKHDAVTYPQF